MRRMRRVFKYGFFKEMDPICPIRVRDYPELEAVRDATPEQRRLMPPGDLEDAQHQWAYTAHTALMQRCYEDGCEAVRPTPLDGYPPEAQMAIMREFLARPTARSAQIGEQ